MKQPIFRWHNEHNDFNSWIKGKIMNLNLVNRWLPMSFFISLLLSFNIQAQSSVWRVTKGDHSLYIAGTIHVLSDADYPLPEEFTQAYALSDKLVLETDMKSLESAAFQQQMFTKLSYPQGQSLRQKLSPEIYAALQAFCESRQLSMAMINRFRPSMLSIILTMHELKRLNFAGSGVDKYFAIKAEADKKSLGQLETATAQLDYIASMGLGQEDEFVRYILEDMKTLPQFMLEMKAAWRDGNIAAMQRLGIAEMKIGFPKLYTTLLVERNNNWLPQIKQFITNDEIELVMVGALHLAGEDGILLKLKQAGFDVSPL